MKLHYAGKFNGETDSLPHGEHMPGAVRFREADSPKKFAVVMNALSIVLTLAVFALALYRCRAYHTSGQVLLSASMALLCMLPHELLHAACYKEDVYLTALTPFGIFRNK